MSLIKDFEDWLFGNSNTPGRNLSKSSAYKYARAINTISQDMIKEGLFEGSFYTNGSLHEIKRDITSIKKNKFFISKNQIGHNMYSVALDHFICFLQERD